MKKLKKLPQAIIEDKIYIRPDIADQVDYSSIFERIFYDEKVCRPCPLKDVRPAHECYSCRGFKERIQLHNTKLIKNVPYVGFPWGDQETIEDLFNIEYESKKVRDKRSRTPMPHKLKWVRPLYTGLEKRNGKKTANQVAIVRAWTNEMMGIIKAAPRTGKSTIAAFIGTKLGMKVLIVAHESTLCRQMAQEYVEATNVKEVAEKAGCKVSDLIHHIDTNKGLDIKKIKKACVVSVNYQKFIHTKQRLNLLKDQFGIMFVDECHQASATAFALFVNSINARYRCGLSATPERRDGKNVIGRMLLGPVTVRSSSSALIPTLTLINTGFDLPYSAPKPRDGGFKFLAKSKTRNNLIVKNVMKDLKNGHKGVIVPVGFIYHIKELKELFIKAFDGDASKVVIYKGGVDKEKRLKEFEEKGKVFIAQWSMVKQGVTLKKPTSMHLVLPRADGHMFYQLVNRICTPQEGKRKPIVRWYVDAIPLSHNCFKTVFWDEVVKYVQGNKAGNPVRYIIKPKHATKFFDLAKKEPRKFRVNPKKADPEKVSIKNAWRFK